MFLLVQVLEVSHCVGFEPYHSAEVHFGFSEHFFTHSAALFIAPSFDWNKSFWYTQYLLGKVL